MSTKGANVAFDLIDQNGDGVLDRNEFAELFKGGEGLPPSDTLHRNASSVTRKLLMNVREDNDKLQTQKDEAVAELRRKEAELRQVHEQLRSERSRADALQNEVSKLRADAMHEGGSTGRSLPTARKASAAEMEQAQGEIEMLRAKLQNMEKAMIRERDDAQTMEDELSEANLELTNVHRKLKSALRQVAALSAQHVLAREAEATAVKALEAGPRSQSPMRGHSHGASPPTDADTRVQQQCGTALSTHRVPGIDADVHTCMCVAR